MLRSVWIALERGVVRAKIPPLCNTQGQCYLQMIHYVSLSKHYYLDKVISVTCITTVDPASRNSFDPGRRRRVLLVILRCYNGVRPLKHGSLCCVTVCNWTGFKAERENSLLNWE